LPGLKSKDCSGIPLTRLSFLDLSSSDVEDVSALIEAGLQVLILSGSKVKDIAVLGEQSIKKLDLSGTAISNLDILKLWPELETIDISNTGITDLSPLVGKNNLGSLFMANSRADLEQVRGIVVASNYHMSLDLSGVEFQNRKVLEGLNFNRLDLSRTNIESIAELKLGICDELNIAHTAVSDLEGLHPETVLLDISFTAIADFSALAACKELEEIHIEGLELDAIQMKKLRDLVPWDCKIHLKKLEKERVFMMPFEQRIHWYSFW
jgi:Leucine-rich repeat (LRR) protein